MTTTSKLGDAYVELQIKDAKFEQQLRHQAAKLAQSASLLSQKLDVAYGKKREAAINAATAAIKRQDLVLGASARSNAIAMLASARSSSARSSRINREMGFQQRQSQSRDASALSMQIRDAQFRQQQSNARRNFLRTVAEMNARGNVRLNLKDEEFRRRLRFAKQLSKIEGRGGGFGGGGSMLGAVVGGGLLVGGIQTAVGSMSGLVSQGFAYNSSIQQSTTSMEVMLGSLGRATKLMDELRVYAAKTPFELPTLNKAAVSLLATKKIASNEVMPILKKLGDAAAGSSEGFAAMPRITRAISQMFTKGKIQAEEMLQLSEAGVPAWSALADMMGKSTAEVQKMGERGQLGIKEILLLIDGLGKQYEGLADKQSKTFAGLSSTIKDGVSKALGDAFRPLFDFATKSMAKMVEVMDSPKFQAFIDRIASGMQTAIDLVSKFASNPMVQAIAKFAALTVASGAFIGSLSIAAGMISSLVAAAPFVAMTAAVAALAIGIKKAFDSELGQRFMRTMKEVYRDVKSIASAIYDQVVPAFNLMKTVVSAALSGPIGKAMAMLRVGVTASLAGFRKLVDYVGVFTADFGKTWDFLATATVGFWEVFRTQTQASISMMSDYFVGTFTKTLPSVVAGFFDGILGGAHEMTGKWRSLFEVMIDSIGVYFRSFYADQLAAIEKLMSAMEKFQGRDFAGALKSLGEAKDLALKPKSDMDAFGGISKAAKHYMENAAPILEKSYDAFLGKFKTAVQANPIEMSSETMGLLKAAALTRGKFMNDISKKFGAMQDARNRKTMEQSVDRLFSRDFANTLLGPFGNAGKAAFGGLGGGLQALGESKFAKQLAEQFGFKLGPGTAKKEQKAEFVGLVDFSKRIQETLGASSEKAAAAKRDEVAKKHAADAAKMLEEAKKTAEASKVIADKLLKAISFR